MPDDTHTNHESNTQTSERERSRRSALFRHQFIYLGLFILSFTTLAFEVTLTRLLSVITWYHMAFFAVSTAMLGSTAGSVIVYLEPRRFEGERLLKSVAKTCLVGAVATPLAVILLTILPVHTAQPSATPMLLLLVTLLCSLPFFFSGIAVSALLTKSSLPIGKLYASDLIGAALGCLFVLGGLEVLSAPSLLLLCGAVSALAGLCFAWYCGDLRLRKWGGWIAAAVALLVIFNAFTNLIRPYSVKGHFDSGERRVLEKWNSFSRVIVSRQVEAAPHLWGPSPALPEGTLRRYYPMEIDGDAFTSIRQFETMQDLDDLRYDLVNMAYYLRPGASACIIGIGGGKDVHSAMLFGHQRIVGIDVNPVFIDLLSHRFRDFANIAGQPGVELVVDEARSYLSITDERFAVIQMSLVDTWAATGAGAFSLSENALYTLEGWLVFLERLSEDGIFTVSRWYNPQNLSESGRTVSLAIAALLQSGASDPSQHIAVVTSKNLSNLLVSKAPFSAQDIATLKQKSAELQFNLEIVPGETSSNPALAELIASRSLEELNQAVAEQPLNLAPPTDESPYFFNLLRLDRLSLMVNPPAGVYTGNLIATLILISLIFSLLLMTLVTIVAPLAIKTRAEIRQGKAHHVLWSAALYFSLIGVGFMLTEIALIQRLSVFLSHPVYALGILLFSLIASSGVGSLLSERLPLARFPWLFIYPLLMAGAILLVRFLTPVLLANLITAPMPTKIVVSILLTAPLGVLMGGFFPSGMRLLRASGDADTPWYWALNGSFGVLASAVAVFISIYISISVNFAIAALCYAVLVLPLLDIYRRKFAKVS